MAPGDESPVKRYPGAGQTVLLVIVAICLQVATGATAFAIAFVAHGDLAPALAELRNAWLLIPAITLANVLTLALGLRGTQERIGPFLRIRAFQPALVPAIVVTCLGLPILLSELDSCLLEAAKWVLGSDFPTPVFFDFTTSPFGSLILLVVVAPLTEEYLFRGLILRGLMTHYSRPKAVVISAVAFAVLHLNLRQGLLALIIGVVFGWWYTRTRSVGPGMVGHALFNGVAWVSAQQREFAEPLGLHPTEGAVAHVPWWLLLGSVSLTLLGIRSFHRKARVIGIDHSPPPPPMAEPPLLFEPPLLPQP